MTAPRFSIHSRREAGVTTILVVEDEKPIRELLAWLLRDLGYQVQEAINGRDAIAQVEEHRPDLVISDVMMPIMGGAELCRWVKSTLKPAPPVILTSSVGAQVADGLGADAFVSKPFDLEELEQAVRQYVTK
jgi:CheY-like chemotaxis protein